MRLTHPAYLAIALILALASQAPAQDGIVPLEPAPADSGPAVPTPDPLPAPQPPVEPPPAEVVAPLPPPGWSWQRQTQNQAGTVTNLHERSGLDDGSAYQHQHTVTNPNGIHSHLRQYEQTDQGYSLLNQQRFYRPDGTLVREHAMAVTGTDPYNYQRQMTHTFRDGRTMEHTITRSYDGQEGTMSQSFVGPNGQVRQSERPWTPDDLQAAAPVRVEPADLPPREADLSAEPPAMPPAPATAAAAEETSFWSRLNPFRQRESKDLARSASQGPAPRGNAWGLGGGHATPAANTAPRRSGFTVGSFGPARNRPTMPPGLARQASTETTVRSMHAVAKTRQAGPPDHANRPIRPAAPARVAAGRTK